MDRTPSDAHTLGVNDMDAGETDVAARARVETGGVTPVRRAVVFTFVFMVMLLCSRIALLLLHPDDFGSLGAGDLAVIFAHGVRFDAAITLALIGLPVLVMTLPFAWARRPAVQRVCGLWCYVVFVIALFLMLADVVYFDYVHRHIGPEIAIATHDLDQNTELALRQHWHILAGFVIASAIAFELWRRLLRGLQPADASSTLRRPLARRAATALVSALVILIIARGAPPGMDRLQVEDAYAGVPPAGAQLVLTGPFTMLQFALRTRDVWSVGEIEWEEALSTTRDLLIAADDVVDSPDFPLARHRGGEAPARKPNVVVVLLEGWSASDLDVLRVHAGKQPLGITPRFDALSAEGVLFTRHYACGQRTRNGIAAVIAGLPSIPGLPYIGDGLEAMNVAYLGGIARAEGYSTHFVQAVQADSQRQNEIAGWAGFEHFTSSENIPAGDVVRTSKDTGSRAWDHDMFDEALRQVAEAPRPFLAFVQTADTHEPYLWPSPKWRKFEDDTRTSRYRNSVFYGDWALGRFFDGARREGWFDDTIFVIVSDHTQRRMEGQHDPPSLFRVPCLVLAPGLAAEVSDRVGSQADIIPTIVDLAGWRTPHAAVGRSLLDGSRDATRGAMCESGELLLRVERDGWVTRTSQGRVEAAQLQPQADLDAIERRMLAFVEVYSMLMLRNRMIPPR